MDEQQPREGYTHIDGDGHEHKMVSIPFGYQCSLCGISFID